MKSRRSDSDASKRLPLACDLHSMAHEIDRRLSEGQFTLKDICATLGIHRHAAGRALHKTFGCSFRQRRAFWQARRCEALRRHRILTGKELANRMGYSNYFTLKRRLRSLGIDGRARTAS